VVAQNKGITSQYRAVGHPIAAAVTEGMVDIIGRDLGVDPAGMRRRNLAVVEVDVETGAVRVLR
jgi:carbon-monoxide dehydrogenase large subunit